MPDLDLLIACDQFKIDEVRAAAWERYEIECWYKAHRDRNLQFKHLDYDMRSKVYQRLCMELDARRGSS